ncbi:glycosyltransferase [Diaminobutyricimonas sp. LJ205]|uniref:glycosyltransferase n=1 Tax=Diaminobutyricimonas sp. LJ205 TaxID=2683590 RepID=UPI0012F4E5BC|nr:glycosyltransferase [Diaminobutyricimonas sp. LJ205]
MHPRVTAILVARDGAKYLNRTIEALARQTRQPDRLIGVDAGSRDDSGAVLGTARPSQIVRVDGQPTFGKAIAHAVHAAQPAETQNEWLWLLAHDNAPDPHALERLLGAVEIAPTVAVAGPKLMRSDDPSVIAAYGETLTRFGASVILVENELDQAQHDATSDVMGVGASGMLVRRSVWTELGGFDPGLPTVDAALDFSIRARLAGHRVVGVPDARVASAGGPELFGRETVSGATTRRIARSAQLHRRLVYASAAAVPLHWLTLVPLAILRSLWHLVAKRPGAIPGEFHAAFQTAFGGSRVIGARRNLGRTRRFGWAAIAPLRMPWEQLREHRAHERAVSAGPAVETVPRERPDFFTGGGAWVVLLAALVGGIAFSPFASASALAGGGLLPLSDSVAELWANAALGWRDIGTGGLGAADPFAAVLAVLGSITFWSPTLSIVGLYLIALPLAALGAWWCVAWFSERSWAPNVAGLLWAFAPPFLTALNDGRLGAVIAHLLLPWLVLCTVRAVRSWGAAASAALLFAAVTAAAPALAPALLLLWIIGMVVRPKQIHRLALIPIPALALFAPLVWDQVRRGNPLGLLADPGLPAGFTPASGWQLSLGAPELGLHGWTSVAAAIGLEDSPAAAVLVAVLLVPLAALALAALFLRGWLSAIAALAVGLLGFVTAVAAAHIEVSVLEAGTTAIWPGSALSLYWLGVTGAAAITVSALGRFVAAPALVTVIASMAVVAPLLVAPLTGTSAVQPSNGRMLPAYVTAEAKAAPDRGTLVLRPTPDGGFAAEIQRGAGTTLDEQWTVAATSTEITEAERQVAELAANLVRPSGYDPVPALTELGIGFIVLGDAEPGAAAQARRLAAQTLDSNSTFVAVGETTTGMLWRYPGLEPTPLERVEPAPWQPWVIGIQLAVFALTLLLAMPTGRRHRRSRRTASELTAPADTFDPEDAHV